jgi:rfaE bifunctional protein nucleotidyltransferase chain/domain
LNVAKKIVSRDEMHRMVRVWQDHGEEVVFTNGCFDILHMGHISYLEAARALGDHLVIGLNSDASTRRLKGETRPINHEHSRAYLLASLSFVDLVTIFDEDTPQALISLLVPDILVKGGDYQADDVVGAEIVKTHGGKVVILPYQEGFSTTAIEEKIRSMKKSPGRDT